MKPSHIPCVATTTHFFILRRWAARLVCVFFSLTLLLLPRLSSANITSANLRAAKFDAKDGDYKGGALTDAEKKQVEDALKKLGEQKGMEDCVKCLTEMLKNGRICREDGTASHGAVTLPDKDAKCDPKAEAINIHPASFKCSTIVLACMLAHECCHAKQTATDYAGNYEKPCYKVELDCLKAFGQDKAGADDKWRYDQIEKLYKEMCPDPPRTPAPEPREGGKILNYKNGMYGIFTGIPKLFTYPLLQRKEFSLSLPMDFVFDMAILPTAGPLRTDTVLLVTGVQAVTNTGILQAFKVQDGQVLSTLFTRSLPNVHPFSIAYDAVRDAIYLLDAEHAQILRGRDTDGDFVFDTFTDVFATLETFPELGGVLSIRPNLGTSHASLFLDTRDLRASDAIDMDASRTILTDTNDDGQADAASFLPWRTLIATAPGFWLPTFPHQNYLGIWGAEGATIKVFLTDKTGTQNLGEIGSGEVPEGTNLLFLSLSQPLLMGQYYRMVDVSNNMATGPIPVSVTLQGKAILLDAASYQNVSLQAFVVSPSKTFALFYSLPLGPNGEFQISGLPPGVYDLSLKGDRWLRRTVTILAFDSPLSLEVTLIPGDANHDNHVDIFDLASLAEAFNTGPSDPTWNPFCDFNNDQSVDIFDLATLAEYFNTDGDPGYDT